MATSGTIGQTVINVATIIDHALRRAGITVGNNTSDIIKSAKENLYLLLRSLSNEGINLWTIDRTIIGLKANQRIYDLPVGTLEILKAVYRTVTLPGGGAATSSDGQSDVGNCFAQDASLSFVQTASNGNIVYDFGQAVVIENVGILPYGNPTLSLVWEYSLDNSTWVTQVTSPENTVYSDGVWSYADIEVPPVSAQYFRVRETNGGTLSVRSLVFGQLPQEIVLGRMNLDMYSQQVQKTTTSRQPVQYWFDRQRTNPKAWIWQVPNFSFDQVVFWRTRQIQDIGSLTNEIEVPERWIDAIMDELALKQYGELPMKMRDPAAETRLEKRADRSRYLAGTEETDDSPIEISTDISAYTA